jgi:D-3-phosphoglycerate dehydrogenase / 2-oxoglutarate reductase
MVKILVADKLAAEGLAILEENPEVTFEVRIGLSPEELAVAARDFDGMIIRSGVKVTSECFSDPGKLRAVARAGVGVDNVDLDAATAAGVLVMNTPDANTVSTAEHTLGLLFALLRRIPDAHAHVAAGEWKRSAFTGRQLSGKTLGIIGLGRVGRAVARRALACDMRVVGYDPLIGAETILDGAVKLYPSLSEMLPIVDCLTLHAKVTDETRHMIAAEQIAAMKPSAVIVNCARGELIDEAALADALNGERLSGAAIDVYSKEPPTDNPLLGASNIVLTPHLGASTREAQTAVATEVVHTLLDYLLRDEIRSAVNVVGLPVHVSDRDRTYLDLCTRMSAILAPWCLDGVSRLTVATRGDSIRELCPTLMRQCLAVLLDGYIDTRVNLVNAEKVAAERGIETDAVAFGATEHYSEMVTVTIFTRDGEHEIEGTVFADGRPRILAIDGYRMEVVPDHHIVLIFNDDRPGVIGLVGKLFGDHEINIADMTLSRREQTALMLLKLDAEPTDVVLAELRKAAPILSVRTTLLPPLECSP